MSDPTNPVDIHPSDVDAADVSLHVGRPNLGNRQAFLDRVNGMLDRRWLSNDGPLVREFEERIAASVGVKHCVTMCNATVALEIASKALGFKDEVIIPSYTFVATAHALQWQGITPIFADIGEASYNVDPESIERMITPRTSGILAVHVWGCPCDTDAIESIAARHGLPVMYDAAHAFACSRRGRMIGSFGACEVFSFHATKFLNSFEGGAVVTNDDGLADRLRLMRNFGFKGYDNVEYLGVNGKMTEVCAAMGLTSLEAIDELVAINRFNYLSYQERLGGLPGMSVINYDESESNNYQYVVVQADPELSPLNRDDLVSVLHSHNVIARKYFWPGCHRMEPYRTTQPDAAMNLPNTSRIAERTFVLPTGQTVDESAIDRVCGILQAALSR